jgi:Xaa-Pro aminopeptidase
MEESYLLLTSGKSLQKKWDQLHPFHVDPDFFAWMGMDIENAVVLIVLDKTQKSVNQVLFFDEPTENDRLWNSIKWDSASIREFGFTGVILPRKELSTKLANIPWDQIFLPSKSSDSTREAYAQIRRIMRKSGYKDAIHKADEMLVQKRMIKSPNDIAKIERAFRITNEIYDKIVQKVQKKELTTEREVQAFVAWEFIRNGGREAFDTIVASGRNACILHYTANNGELKDGDLLLIDFGIELDGYGADISRTFPVSGTFTDRQQVLYDAVMQVKKFAENTLKPGVTRWSWNTQVLDYMDNVCKDLWILEDTPKGKHRMPHSIGHFLGLDTHDVGGNDTPFVPGMVLTIEPGIYIRDEGIGIRIEDDYVITETGCKKL